MTMAQTGRNLDTEQWQELDRLHHLHPFTDSKTLHRKGSRIITRADGVYLWDSEGRRILDAMAGLWCVNIGYGRKELSPKSDIDLMFLYPVNVSKANLEILQETLVSEILYPLWDLGLKVGHASRNIRDAISQARESIENKNAMMESPMYLSMVP